MTDLPANIAALTDAEILDLANASDERTNRALVTYLLGRRYGRVHVGEAFMQRERNEKGNTE